MKKLISLIVLVFMLSGIFVSCDILQSLPEDEPKVEAPETPEEMPETPEETPETPDDKPVLVQGTKVGNLFLDLTLTDLNGNQVNTADLRGKMIVFNVWATWCPPCKAELPDFNELASEYEGEVVFIAVHCYDSGMYDMPSYVADNFPDTKIIFAYDTAESAAYYAAGGVGYVPQTAIIDRNGIIIYSDSGALTRSWLASFIENNNKE